MKDEIQNLMYYIMFLKPSGLSKYCLKSSDYRNKCFKPTNYNIKEGNWARRVSLCANIPQIAH